MSNDRDNDLYRELLDKSIKLSRAEDKLSCLRMAKIKTDPEERIEQDAIYRISRDDLTIARNSYEECLQRYTAFLITGSK
jgi:hypothetical protein